MAMLESIVGVIVLMLLLILLIVLFVCKPWRLFPRFRSRTIKAGDLERPLVSDDGNLVQEQSNELTREYDLEGACYQNEGLLRPSRGEGLIHKQRIPSASPHLTPFPGVISELSEDILLGQTLKLTSDKVHSPEGQRTDKQDGQNRSPKIGSGNDRLKELPPKIINDPRSCLSLEVISGPSTGLHCSVNSTSASRLPLTLGRVSPSDLLLKDSEVSGKHALINWNSDRLKWELVDMGSLNGTLLNSQPVNHPDSGSRHWGKPVELASGDIITLGTTSNVYIQITAPNECHIPFGVGVASDPMALRRGAKKLPMEDVCYYQWPIPGVDQFGLFGICDGHGGQGAAKSASIILSEVVASILSDSLKRERVLLQRDASEVLKDAFLQTESRMNHYYEGCTATVLLVWIDDGENFFVQCANVGDSACVMNIDGKQIKLTEDHRITSSSERLRIQETGEPLKDGETRLCGLNLARMLGDKFLKQQDSRFSSEPYISEAVYIDGRGGTFALIASDGFWDVIGVKKAIQLVLQAREKFTSEENSAEKVANSLLNEARTLRTKDNTSIIFLDFNSRSSISGCKVDS